MKEALLEDFDPVQARALNLLSATWAPPTDELDEVGYRCEAVHAVRHAPPEHQWATAGLWASVPRGGAASTADSAELAQGLRALVGVAKLLRGQSLDRPATWLLMQALDLAVRLQLPAESSVVPLVDLLPRLATIDSAAALVIGEAWSEPWDESGASRLTVACRLAIDLLATGKGGAT